jgi:hypothetical protein
LKLDASMIEIDCSVWQCREQQVQEVCAMDVVSLATLSRECGRCRPRSRSYRIALRTAQRDAIDRRADLAQLIVETDAFQ